MKRILYTLIVLSTLCFTGCREDRLEGENPGKEIALTFSSRSSDLSTEALSQEINALHLFIFKEDGTFSQQKEFAGLANVTPVKLPLGTYTFAYLSNIDKKQISGLTEGARLEDITLTLLTDANGDIIAPGSIFSGTDKITVGENKTSDAALSRMVGRLDINVSGLKGGVVLQSVTLLGSPKSVNFNGTVQDPKASLKIPMNPTEELATGQAIAFPTCIDSLARLEFVIVAEGETKTYTSVLQNKVEANKIHTINAKVNLSGGIFDVTLDMNIEPWGASESEDITANQIIYLDSLSVKFLFEPGSTVNLSRVYNLSMDVTKDNQENYHIYANKYDPYNMVYISNDTLIVKSFSRAPCGTYTIQNITLRDSLENNLYALPAPVKNVVLDATGCAVVQLPKMKDVADEDANAMFALRDAMSAAGVNISRMWNGDNINLWYEVDVDADGRVVGIGYSGLEDYDKDYDHNRAARSAINAKAKTTASGDGTSSVWRLPDSFQKLTALKYFNIDESSFGCLETIPDFIKNMKTLEELSVYTNATTLPELPGGLKLLSITGEALTEIPSHIGNLTNLQILTFETTYDEKNESIDLSKSKISSINMEFRQLVNLRYLYVQAGTNCAFPNTLWDLAGNSLVGLGLGGFNSIQIPSSITRWSSLEELILANDNLTPSNIESIQGLALNDLTIYSPVFAQNGLPDWMGKITSLEYLCLDNCGITTIPESFNGLTNLRDLDLEHNPDLTGKLPSGLLALYNNSTLYVYAPHSPNFSPDGITLEVTPEYIDAPATGGEYIVEIKTEAEWNCQLHAYRDNFVTVIFEEGTPIKADSISGEGELRGTGNAKLKVKVKQNLFGGWNFRDGDLVINTGRHSRQIRIDQQGMTEETLAADKSSFSVQSGDIVSIDVTSNTEWYVETELVSGEGSLYMEPSEGQGSMTIKGEFFKPTDAEGPCELRIHIRSRQSDKVETVTITGN